VASQRGAELASNSPPIVECFVRKIGTISYNNNFFCAACAHKKAGRKYGLQ
jgi:hypothetical protein